MKLITPKKEGPLLLVVIALTAATATGSIFFTATPAPAYAHDLTEEDILSLQDPGQTRVTICHNPDGNTDKRHEITVGEPAVATHVIQHGDTIGPCQPDL
jgi:hypothetical protein